jgi:hypothetical protein
MRKKIRKPLTTRGVNLIVNELAKLKEQGHEIGEVLDQSTRNNWPDVYPLKGKHNGNGFAGNGSKPKTADQQRIDHAFRESEQRDRERSASYPQAVESHD